MSVKLSARLTEIFSLIPNCEIFADIACDHGYIAAAMLIKNKCNKAIFSDISEKCLLKAQNLLKPFVENKKAIGLVSDGFEKIEFCHNNLQIVYFSTFIVAYKINCCQY